MISNIHYYNPQTFTRNNKPNQKNLKKNERNKVKSLRSDMIMPIRPFTSIFDCKKQPSQKNKFLESTKYEKRQKIGYYGPLIVTHILKRDKIIPKKRKKSYLLPITPYKYFQNHAHCRESREYWDPINPKILRHYTPTKYNEGGWNKSVKTLRY